MERTKTCPICCRIPATWITDNSELQHLKCQICGEFKFTDSASPTLAGIPENSRWRLSAFVRRAISIPILNSANIYKSLATIPSQRTPLDLIDEILSAVAAADSPAAGRSINIYTDYPFFAARSAEDLLLAIGEIGRSELHLFSFENSAGPSVDLRLTAKGWAYASDVRRRSRESNRAFVAMSFADECLPIYQEGIEPVLLSCGYVQPFRVDRKEHNELIDDVIVAEIRKSSLLVADLTGQRAGVYFEAGFGSGLGIPVIYSCIDGEQGSVHFDVNHRNIILWKSRGDLALRLKARIEATVQYPKLLENQRISIG